MKKPNRARVVFFVGVLCLGFALGSCGGDEPPPEPKVVTKTRFVKVPVVKTHVEYRDKYVGMPDSCVDGIEVLRSVDDTTGMLTKNAGIIEDALGDVGSGRVMKDIASVNKAIARIKPAKSELENAANEQTLAITRISILMERCEKEVADGP